MIIINSLCMKAYSSVANVNRSGPAHTTCTFIFAVIQNYVIGHRSTFNVLTYWVLLFMRYIFGKDHTKYAVLF